MLIKIVNIVVVISDMNSLVIIDWLKTFSFNKSLTLLFIIKSHNSALIRLYLINILHDK